MVCFMDPTGQWYKGKMEGVGVLTGKGGDVYEGSFTNNLYDGIGTYRSTKGDVFMG
jgi:hypothetical protein